MSSENDGQFNLTPGEVGATQTNILHIYPELHFPLEQVFEVPDEFNGSQRGTHYYRTARGTLRGPFANEAEAGFYLEREANEDCA